MFSILRLLLRLLKETVAVYAARGESRSCSGRGGLLGFLLEGPAYEAMMPSYAESAALPAERLQHLVHPPKDLHQVLAVCENHHRHECFPRSDLLFVEGITDVSAFLARTCYS